MGRSRKSKKDIFHDLHEMLLVAPWWAGPPVALIVYSAFRWFLPWVFAVSNSDDAMAKVLWPTLTRISIGVAPWAAICVLMVWLFALLGKWSNRERLDRQTGIESIRGLSWQDFERLLAEAFRRQGYSVEHLGGAGPDGGVDLRLKRGGELVLVQCKQWLSWSVGVKIVRELHGVVAAQSATRGIVVTSGTYTQDAAAFARTVPMTLIDGDELLRLIADVRSAPAIAEPVRPAFVAPAIHVMPAVPECPMCGVTMALRTAKKGSQAGSQFWGCTKYPSCRGTRPLSTTT